MAEIKVNIVALENKICKLRNLKDTCNNLSAKEKSMEGSGDSVIVVNQIDKEYAAIQATFQTLIDNSISFFENVKSSVVQADTKAANK